MAEAGTSSKPSGTRRRRKEPEDGEGPKKRKKKKSLRRRLDQEAASSSETTGRDHSTPSEEPTRTRKRKASTERSVERKRPRVSELVEAGTSSGAFGTRRRRKEPEDGEGPKKRKKSLRRRLLDQEAASSSETTGRDHSTPSEEPTRTRKRKASPERSVERKRARMSKLAEAGTSSGASGTRRRKKVREDGEGPKKKKKSLRRRLLDQEAASSSETTGRETSSDPLEGCSQRGEKRKAADAGEMPTKKRRLQPVPEEEDREELSIEELRAEFHSKYEQHHKLGAGGCGSVFAGRRKSDSLPVAIKHVQKEYVLCKHVDQNGKQLSVEVVAMLKIQAGTAGSAGTSAPISLLDWYDLGQELILVLERPVPSEDLSHYVEGKGGMLKEEEAKIILKQLLDAAIDLEKKGIFHRDIKPENILIETGSEVPRVRLLDFGLCCFAKKRSYYRAFYGTVEHVPPEWYNRQTYRAGPTTVYQMGVVLFEMLHRHTNFDTTQYFDEQLHISRKLSKGCRSFLMNCLNRIPECRPTLMELLGHPWLR